MDAMASALLTGALLFAAPFVVTRETALAQTSTTVLVAGVSDAGSGLALQGAEVIFPELGRSGRTSLACEVRAVWADRHRSCCADLAVAEAADAVRQQPAERRQACRAVVGRARERRSHRSGRRFRLARARLTRDASSRRISTTFSSTRRTSTSLRRGISRVSSTTRVRRFRFDIASRAPRVA